jgi:hypothetical protein
VKKVTHACAASIHTKAWNKPETSMIALVNICTSLLTVYVKYVSSSLSTNWNVYPEFGYELVGDNSGTPLNELPVQLPEAQ